MNLNKEEIMKIVTFADCKKKAKELGYIISAEEIARAFGIKTPQTDLDVKLLEKLAHTTTQDGYWEVYNKANKGSKVRKTALAAILQGATTQEERWSVYAMARHKDEEADWTDLMQAALEAIKKQCRTDLSIATTQEERRMVFIRAPSGSKEQDAAIKALCW